MKQDRRAARIHRRLSIRYSTGGGALPRAGNTLDISAGGLFLNAAAVLAPGTHVLGRLDLPDGRRAEVHGIVAWAKHVPRAFNAVVRGGMGLRLLWAEGAYYEYLALTAA